MSVQSKRLKTLVLSLILVICADYQVSARHVYAKRFRGMTHLVVPI